MLKKLFRDKHGINLSFWIEAIVLTLGVLSIMVFILGDINNQYGTNYVIPITDNSTMASIQNFVDTSNTQVQTGSLIDTIFGPTLKYTFGLIRLIFGVLGGFLSGAFIVQTANLLNLGQPAMIFVGLLQILWVASIIFFVIYSVTKVKT